MKNSNAYPILLVLVISYLLTPQLSRANGLCIANAETGVYLTLVSTHTEVIVNDQIATVKTVQTYRNQLGYSTAIKFGFPMSGTGSATGLRWQYGGNWYAADFSPVPQDTTLPGGGGGGTIEEDIRQYLGANPLYFDLTGEVAPDSLITIELTYVDLLPYEFNIVSFAFPGNYTAFQTDPLELQHLFFELHSQRTIDQLSSASHPNAALDLSPHLATLLIELSNQPANQDFDIRYQLNADELGLFSFSTYLADSVALCDTHGQGFFAFIVEPDPSENTEVIQKVFTLIIDRSGSMSGDKMVQARNAATFIVENLNPGDYFNVIDFDDIITSFQPDHVPFTPSSMQQALTYINGLYARGATNISGAFTVAIQDFQNNNTDQANIILFFTDGQATAGITNTQGIVNHVQQQIIINEVQDLSIFNFGIGESSVNKQLLTLLAEENNGFAEFLENDELEAVISRFYLTVRNPVLLNTSMSFDPPIIVETYPRNLPNLYKGQQLIVTGRYSQPGNVTVHFSGEAFGQPVSYEYPLQLADTSVAGLQFLPRLWSKKKIGDLYGDFLSASPGSVEAEALEEQIVGLSVCYGVISPFTSFEDNTGGGTTAIEEIPAPTTINSNPLVAVPNPFRSSTRLVLPQGQTLGGTVYIAIYDIHGRLVYSITLQAGQPGLSEWGWDGVDSSGRILPAGVYTVRMFSEDILYVGKVVKE